MLLDFVGPDGVEAAGKFNLLPIRLIGELDSRLSRPLNLELKRPQLKSHPYLQGLHLLPRASGLTRVAETGAKARLVRDQEIEIGTIPLEPGQTMELHYDFGDDWLFAVKLERIEPPGAKIKVPKILEKHGKPPEQYPGEDD